MESLLALAFDNLSSYDHSKIKKGVKQVEGVLASMCLSAKHSSPRKSSRKPRHRSSSSTDTLDASTAAIPPTTTGEKALDELADDPAFRNFLSTQEGFQYNIATHLLDTLERLVGRSGDGQYDLLIISVMDLLQGLLLLHPPSKKLFSREQNMNLILDLIEPINCPAIQSSSLSILLVALITVPENIRCFEALDGLLAVTSLFRTRGTGREVRGKLTEVMFVYLLPETPTYSLSSSAGGGRPSSKHGRKRGASATGTEGGNTMTVNQKMEMLGRYVSNVDEFVRDLRARGPFECMVV